MVLVVNETGKAKNDNMKREESLKLLADEGRVWDMVIIGGGATGLGCAVDAVLRGYSVALFEQDDFAKGTSSRSTKLVHGGVRYLQHGDVALVFEARTGPHEGQCAAPGQGPGVRDLELPLEGQFSLFLRARFLRPAFVGFRLWPFTFHFGREDGPLSAGVRQARIEGRYRLSRRPVR